MSSLPVGRKARLLLLTCAASVALGASAPVGGSVLDTGRRAVELARETFADDSWRERWVVEGRAEFSLREGRLVAHAPDGATLWLRRPLPANVLIELEAGVDPQVENNAANLNIIVHARENDGSPYRFGRSGEYGEYHKIPNYIVTFT
ncbi:MAG TPA: hypothetical protein VM029_03305, partial [Opitutaceae bacterium]|nr:hypothetical protein [Opitutaceae bacterium]